MTLLINKLAATSRVACAVGVLALAAGVAPIGAAVAQQAPSIVMADANGTSTVASAAALMARAQEMGELRVIVGVDASFSPEASLGAEAAASQRAGIAAAQEQVMSAMESASSVRQFETIPYMAMTVPPSDLAKMMNMPGVTSIQEDVPVPPSLADSVPLVGTKQLWNRGHKGDGAVVAILDTGVRPNHTAFRDPGGRKIVGSACFSTDGNISETVCPNGRETQVSNRNGRAAPNCSNSVSGCDHGTHVAAIAAGFQNRNHGMAQRSDILAVQVFSRFNSSQYCGSNAPCVLSFTSDQIAGLEQVLRWRNRGVMVASANMSLGGGQYTEHCDDTESARKAVIDNLLAAGVATVIATGNNGFDGSVGAPSCISTAVSVGSTTKMNGMSSFSNHDEIVDLLAPGSSILAADADNGRKALTTKSGTSMATPHVAGAFALLKAAVPGATPHEIERALKCTGYQIQRDGTPKPRISMNDAYKYLRKLDTRKAFSFRRAVQVRRWIPILGDWTHANNAMRVVADRSQTWYLTLAPFCANDISVMAKMSRTDTDTSQGWANGIALATSASSDGKFTALLFLYYVDDNDLTTVRIYQAAGYDGVINSGEVRQLCADQFTDRPRGAERKVEAEKVGNNLTFKLDRQTVCTATTDARFTDGHAGIIMAAPNADSSHILEVSQVVLRALSQSETITAQEAAQVAPSIGSVGNDESFSSVATVTN